MRTLISCIHLLSMLAPLTWGLTLSLVATLVSNVTSLMHLLLHLLLSSCDLVWLINPLLASLMTQIPVWLVVHTHLFIIILCHHSLAHPCTSGQDHIGLHHMTMLRRMISRSQDCKKLLRTPILLFLMIVDKVGEELD
jgi:hypothetical protein